MQKQTNTKVLQPRKSPKPPPKAKQNHLSSRDSSRLMPTHKEYLFTEGRHYFDSLIQAIENAKQSIQLEVYNFNYDELGESVGEALVRAAKKGVNVRLLIDGAGTPFWGGQFAASLEKAGVKSRIFHPFPWGFWQWGRSVVRLPLILKALYLLLKINSRNHRKMCLIDNAIAYIGSFNINQCHLEKEKGGKGWRDTAVCLTHLNLDELSMAFEAVWNHSPLQERLQRLFQPVDMNAVLRLNNTLYRRRVLYKNLLRRIARAKQRIWITNAYFLPDNFILKKLKEAAETGIDVRILLPCVSDVLIMPLTTSTFYRRLLLSGVKIFEYLPSMLHAKTLIIDDWFLIGSTNLNSRSILHDLEIDVNVKHPTSKQILETRFFLDLEHSREICRHDYWKKRPIYQRLIGKLLLYLRYWF